MLRVVTEREKEVSQQLKQVNDAVSRLEDELRQAVDRKRQLQKEFDAALWEKEMKERDSKISVLIINSG